MFRKLVPCFVASILAAGCDQPLPSVNIFTIEDDIELGQQLRDEINATPADYNVVSEADYPEAYAHLHRMRDAILASGEVEYDDEFEWEMHLIHDDATLNAFAAPGGYIWVYTGLIRFLDREDDLVGVLGHEIAHADRRHATDQLTKAYGLSVLLGVVFGSDPGLIPELAAGLVGLNFSRADESESDEFSVVYLCDTGYAANGAAGFFEKLMNDTSIAIPEFLSTHPSSDTRVEEINALAESLDCPTEANPDGQWQALLDSLPPEQAQTE